MTSPSHSIAENFNRITGEIQSRASGRQVTIVAVAKFQPESRIREAIKAGLTDFANNYAQEGETLMKAISEPSLRWHFIGHIQSRKVKYLPAYQCVQSLDREDVARALNEKMKNLGAKLPVLIEINIGDESQKSGIAPASLPHFLNLLKECPFLKVQGLMGMPPPLEPVELRRPYFARLKQLFDTHRVKENWEILSMGTSADYLVAVEEGATMVRLGACLLGERPPKN